MVWCKSRDTVYECDSGAEKGRLWSTSRRRWCSLLIQLYSRLPCRTVPHHTIPYSHTPTIRRHHHRPQVTPLHCLRIACCISLSHPTILVIHCGADALLPSVSSAAACRTSASDPGSGGGGGGRESSTGVEPRADACPPRLRDGAFRFRSTLRN